MRSNLRTIIKHCHIGRAQLKRWLRCRCHRVYGPAQFSVLREYGPPPPRTQLPREYGPSIILYIQGIQSGGGGGLNSLIEWRFDFDDPVYSVYN